MLKLRSCRYVMENTFEGFVTNYSEDLVKILFYLLKHKQSISCIKMIILINCKNDHQYINLMYFFETRGNFNVSLVI